MAKPNEKKTPRAKSSEARRIRAVYAKSKAEFSASDLQRFTEIEEGIPLEQLLAELEAIQRKRAGKSK